MTAETDLPPLPERFDCTNGSAQWCYGCYTMTRDDLGDYVLAEDYDALRNASEALQAEIEALREEIGRLLDSREREGDRLDWLLARLPGDVIRDLVGEMICTSDVGEWRDRIDKAARFKPPNP